MYYSKHSRMLSAFMTPCHGAMLLKVALGASLEYLSRELSYSWRSVYSVELSWYGAEGGTLRFA